MADIKKITLGETTYNIDASKLNTRTSTTTAPSASSDDTTIPTSKAVWTAIGNGIRVNDAMVFKGTIGSSGATITALPATHYQGWSYKVITAGTYAGQTCGVGDMIICITDGTSANNAHWTVIQNNVDTMTGATSSAAGATGLVPAPAKGQQGLFLKGDGTWATPTNTTYTFNGAVSTIKDNNLTTSRALISNSDGKVAVSAVTSTELGYLDGVTSNVQTQLNGKSATGHTHDDRYLGKTTYEWNKEFAAGSNGAVSLGRYNLYDTQLTFDITTTTTLTISGKLVIASQNGRIQKVTVFGDASNTLAGYLTIYQSAVSNSRSWIEVFCNFPGWSKNKVHIYGVALNSETVTNQMTSVTFTNGVPSGVTSGDTKWTGTIVNDITSNCAAAGHTHDVNIAASSGTNELTLAHGTKYALTAGGQSFVFTTPSDNNTWRPVGTGASDAAAGNHTHDVSIVTSTGTNELTLAHGTKYALTAGGQSFVFTMPSDSNTHYTKYLQIKGNGTEAVKFTQDADKSLNLKPGTNVSISAASGEITISATDTNTWRPVGTGAADAAAGNHTHSISIASSTGTNQLTLAHGTKYSLTAGGQSFVFTMPTDNNTDTKVTSVGNHYTPAADANAELTASLSGTAGTYAKDTEYTVVTGIKAQRDAKGHITGITYTAQKIKDTNTTYTIPTVNNATLTLNVGGQTVSGNNAFTANDATNTTYNVPSATASTYGVIKVSSVNSTAVTVNSESTTAGRYYPVELNSDGKAIVNVPWTSSTINNAGAAAKPVYIENGEAKQCTGISPELSISEYATGKAMGDVFDAAFNPSVSMAASTGTNQLTLSLGSKYSISVNGKSFVFTMPSSPLNAVGFGTMSEMGAFKYNVSSGGFTESCHIQGYISNIWTTGYVNVTDTAYHVTLWQGDNLHYFTYNRTSSTWTREDSRTFSRTNHTHTTSLAAGTTSDTSSITLSHGSKYKLTAGGNSVVFTMPSQYSLPAASSSTRGGIKIGYSASNANIPLKLSSEKGYVTLTGTAIKSAVDNGGDLSWAAPSYTFKDGTSGESLRLDGSLIYANSSNATKMVVSNAGNMGIAGYLYKHDNTSKRAPWSTTVYNIEKVTALPASPDANTLYIVVEG